MKRWIATAVAAVMLMGAGTAIAAPAETGVLASYKNVITIDWIKVDEDTTLYFTFFGDFDRAVQRSENNGDVMPMGIEGFKTASGEYRVFVNTGYFRMPLGLLDWEQVIENIPNMKSVGDLRPIMFNTFIGYEDVFATASFNGEDTDGLVKAIRTLYEVEFESYNNAMFGR